MSKKNGKVKEQKSERGTLGETDLEKQLLTWVAGMLAGCEGCEAEAREWAERIDLRHEASAQDA